MKDYTLINYYNSKNKMMSVESVGSRLVNIVSKTLKKDGCITIYISRQFADDTTVNGSHEITIYVNEYDDTVLELSCDSCSIELGWSEIKKALSMAIDKIVESEIKKHNTKSDESVNNAESETVVNNCNSSIGLSIAFFLHIAKRLSELNNGCFSRNEIRNASIDYYYAMKDNDKYIIKCLIDEMELFSELDKYTWILKDTLNTRAIASLYRC